jgi:hypothetical protein
MYTEFLTTLSRLSQLLDEAVKIGGDENGMPAPYLYGKVEVLLDGETVGHFIIEDEYVIYQEVKKSG